MNFADVFDFDDDEYFECSEFDRQIDEFTGVEPLQEAAVTLKKSTRMIRRLKVRSFARNIAIGKTKRRAVSEKIR